MIVVVDYGVGNLGSILNMLRKLGVAASVSSNKADIRRAAKLILPGVGAFDAGMRSLVETGLIPSLEESVLEDGVPILGICLGLQLLGKGSEEGTSGGLGWLDMTSQRFRFPPGAASMRVPHIGWNTVSVKRTSPLMDSMEGDVRFYFVHSYYLCCADEDDVVATTHYGLEFPSVVQSKNIAGTQFHPEKSHRYGLQLLRNFATSA